MPPNSSVKGAERGGALRERLDTLPGRIAGELAQRIRPTPEAIVLTGSFARGEGSGLVAGDRLLFLSDMEFMVVFRSGVDRVKLQEVLNSQARKMGNKLGESGIECELEFRAVTPQYFRDLRPHIFGYELISCGRTVWGKAEILSSARRFTGAIPLWDAWRMLNNRLLEQLQWIEAIQNGNQDDLLKAFYQLLKAHLDIGTTLLVFAGRYENSYARRAAALKEWAAGSNHERREDFMEEIARKVCECTAFKLSPDTGVAPLGVPLGSDNIEELRSGVRKAVLELVPLARTVWRWQAFRLANISNEVQAEDAFLQDSVLRTQGLVEKLRAWTKLLLIAEVQHRRGLPKRAFELIWHGSPRYLIYRVASSLYFQLPDLFEGLEVDKEAIKLEPYLPVLFPEFSLERRAWWRVRNNTLTGWRLYLRNQWL